MRNWPGPNLVSVCLPSFFPSARLDCDERTRQPTSLLALLASPRLAHPPIQSRHCLRRRTPPRRCLIIIKEDGGRKPFSKTNSSDAEAGRERALPPSLMQRGASRPLRMSCVLLRGAPLPPLLIFPPISLYRPPYRPHLNRGIHRNLNRHKSSITIEKRGGEGGRGTPPSLPPSLRAPSSSIPRREEGPEGNGGKEGGRARIAHRPDPIAQFHSRHFFFLVWQFLALLDV